MGKTVSNKLQIPEFYFGVGETDGIGEGCGSDGFAGVGDGLGVGVGSDGFIGEGIIVGETVGEIVGETVGTAVSPLCKLLAELFSVIAKIPILINDKTSAASPNFILFIKDFPLNLFN